MRRFLGFLVIDPDHVISSSCSEVASVAGVVQSEDLVVGLDSVPKLLPGFGQELEQVSVCISRQDCRSDRLELFGGRPPAEGVDWGMAVGLLILDVGVDLGYFCVFEEVVDAYVAVAGAACNEGVLLCKFGEHDLCFVFGGDAESEFMFEGNLLDDSS